MRGPRQKGTGTGKKLGLLCRDGAKAGDIIMGIACPKKGSWVGWETRKLRGKILRGPPKEGVTASRGTFQGGGVGY